MGSNNWNKNKQRNGNIESGTNSSVLELMAEMGFNQEVPVPGAEKVSTTETDRAERADPSENNHKDNRRNEEGARNDRRDDKDNRDNRDNNRRDDRNSDRRNDTRNEARRDDRPDNRQDNRAPEKAQNNRASTEVVDDGKKANPPAVLTASEISKAGQRMSLKETAALCSCSPDDLKHITDLLNEYLTCVLDEDNNPTFNAFDLERIEQALDYVHSKRAGNENVIPESQIDSIILSFAQENFNHPYAPTSEQIAEMPARLSEQITDILGTYTVWMKKNMQALAFSVETRIRQMSDALDEQTEAMNKMKRDMEQSRMASEDAKEAASRVSNGVNSVSTSIADLSDKLNGLGRQSQLEAMSSRLNKLDKLDELRGLDKLDELDKLDHKLGNLKNLEELKKLNTVIEDNKKNEELLSSLTEATKENFEALASLSTIQGQLKSMQSPLDSMQSRISNIEKKVSETSGDDNTEALSGIEDKLNELLEKTSLFEENEVNREETDKLIEDTETERDEALNAKEEAEAKVEELETALSEVTEQKQKAYSAVEKIYEEKKRLESESEEKDNEVSELRNEINALKAEINKLRDEAERKDKMLSAQRQAPPQQNTPIQRSIPADGGRVEKKFNKNNNPARKNTAPNVPSAQNNNQKMSRPMPPQNRMQSAQPSWDRGNDEVIPYKGPQRQTGHSNQRQADVELQTRNNPVTKPMGKPKKRGFFGSRR